MHYLCRLKESTLALKTKILAFAAVFCTLIALASTPIGYGRISFSPDEKDSIVTPAKEGSKQVIGYEKDSINHKDSTATDSIPLRPYTILPDTTQNDSVPKDTMPRSKNALDEPVTYSAQDSITFDYKNNRAHLYGSSKVNYL